MAPTPDCVASGLAYAGSSAHVDTPTHQSPSRTHRPAACPANRLLERVPCNEGRLERGALDEPKRLNRDALICVCVYILYELGKETAFITEKRPPRSLAPKT